MSAIPATARKLVRARSNDQCSRCGGPGYQIHHRQRRREGGHAVGNLVLLCASDHRHVHAHPDTAKNDGYIVHISVDNPSSIPILTFMGSVLFDNDGGIRFI